MQAAIDRIMQTYGMLVNMTATQEQFVREKVTNFLRVCPGTSNGITEFSEHEAD